MTEENDSNDKQVETTDMLVIQPRSFDEVMDQWLNTRSINSDFFHKEKERANKKTTITTVLIYTIIVNIFSTIYSLLVCTKNTDSLRCTTSNLQLSFFLMGFIIYPLLYFGTHYFLFVFGRLFGGNVDFKVQVYLGIFITLPINILLNVMHLLSFLPISGAMYPFIFYSLKYFSYSLMYVMIKEINQFSSKQMIKFTFSFLGFLMFVFSIIYLFFLFPDTGFNTEMIQKYLKFIVSLISIF